MDKKQRNTYSMYTMGNMPAAGATACDCPEGFACYTIQEGETLLGIARGIGISLRQLLTFNPGLNPYYYRAGDVLCVPAEHNPCPSGHMYIVARGDTLFNIGERFGISLDDMIAANPHVNPNRMIIGQVVCIPPAKAAAPVPAPTAPPVCETPVETALPPEPEIAPVPAPVYPALPTVPQSVTKENVVAAADALVIGPAANSDETAGEHDGLVETRDATARCCAPLTTYTVQDGETLMDIMLRHNLSYGSMRAVNADADLVNISKGALICIPPESTTGGCMPGAGAYVIMLGDTLATLAKKFDVPMLEIMVNNPLMAPGDFMVGRVICMPVI